MIAINVSIVSYSIGKWLPTVGELFISSWHISRISIIRSFDIWFVFFFCFRFILWFFVAKTHQWSSSTHIVFIAIKNTTREYTEAVESLLYNDERESQQNQHWYWSDIALYERKTTWWLQVSCAYNRNANVWMIHASVDLKSLIIFDSLSSSASTFSFHLFHLFISLFALLLLLTFPFLSSWLWFPWQEISTVGSFAVHRFRWYCAW